MKCVSCGNENKEEVKFCKKCGVDTSLEQMWTPTWKWHLKTLGIIYVVLIGAYFAISQFLNNIPEPYRLREISSEVTPWLK